MLDRLLLLLVPQLMQSGLDLSITRVRGSGG